MDFLCQHENKIARTKTAVKSVGFGALENTQLLGTSHLLIFFARGNRWGAVWVVEKKSGPGVKLVNLPKRIWDTIFTKPSVN